MIDANNEKQQPADHCRRKHQGQRKDDVQETLDRPREPQDAVCERDAEKNTMTVAMPAMRRLLKSGYQSIRP